MTRQMTRLATTFIALLAVWLIGMPLTAQAAPSSVGASNEAIRETPQITQFQVTPKDIRAGRHSTINIWMGFCETASPFQPLRMPPSGTAKTDWDVRRVTNATNTTPIKITVAEPHKLRTGDQISVHRVEGNTAANNPAWKITVPSGQITNVTTTSPIVVTSPGHGLETGDQVFISGVNGASNSHVSNRVLDRDFPWTVTVTSPDTFELNGSTAGDPYTSGGTWTHATKFTLDGSSGNGAFIAGSNIAQAAYAPEYGCNLRQSEFNSLIKDFIISLPPGLLGNPTAVIPCPQALWILIACPAESVVGNSLALGLVNGAAPFLPNKVAAIQIPTPLYVLETVGFEPARLGTSKLPADPPGPLPILVGVRSTGDFGVDSSVDTLPSALSFAAKLTSIDTNLCKDVPCHPTTLQPLNAATARPFSVNPTSCKQATTRLLARPYPPPPGVPPPAGPSVSRAASTFTPTDCGGVPFTPDVTVKPVSDKPGAPTSTEVAIQYPDYVDADIWQSALKDATVILPDGMSLAAGGGVGLESCTAEEFGFGNDKAIACPEGSRIGKVVVETPVLSRPIEGRAYLSVPSGSTGAPTDASPWKLFIVLEGQGVRIKLRGDVSLIPNDATPDPNDRLIKNVFTDNPETPFTRFELTTKGPDAADPNNRGAAALANPDTCGSHKGNVTLAGFSGATHVVAPELNIPQANCPSPRPFAPAVTDASAKPEDAAANSISHLRIERPDGNQNIKRLNFSLPAGALGSLATAPRCQVDLARAGDCPDESKVGIIRNTVGYGAGNLTVPGSLYIGEALQPGDAASFIIVVPAKVGPIDLGRVVVANRVELRQTDTGVDVLSGEIPTILQGIPLPIQTIDITVNRENFFLNPTGCDTRNFAATFFGDEGGQHTSTFAAAALNCDKVPFNPRLRLIAGAEGYTRVGALTPLKAIVTQTDGEANIKSARVVIPDILRPNVPRFQNLANLCNGDQLAARACPASSTIGNARVRSPVLPFELSGPVYAVLERGAPLPKLAVFLRGGGFEIVLIATNGFEGIKILNIFPSVPDAAQSYFELNVNRGPTGALIVHDDLCTTRPLPEIGATFTAQSGKVVSSKPRLEVAGCAASVGTLSLRSQRVRITRKGVAKIKMRCSSSARCRGRLTLARKYGRKSFSIGARKTARVRIKLSRKATRAVLRAKRGKRVRATARVTGGRRAFANITFLPPKKKR